MKKFLQLFSKQALLLCLILISSMSWGHHLKKSRVFNLNLSPKTIFANLCFVMMFVGQLAISQTTIENQSFAVSTIPAGWTSTAVDYTGSYAKFTASNSNLTSPVYDLTNYTDVKLSFSVAKFGIGDNGPLTVEISNDGGTTWTAQTFTSGTPSSSTYVNTTNNVITVTGSAVRIRFIRNDSKAARRFKDYLLIGTFTTPTTAPVVTAATVTGAYNTAVNYQVVASNSPTSYAIFGTLPTGLNMDSATGIISGIPTAIGSFSINVTASNEVGTSDAATINFEISKANQTITFEELADLTYGAADFNLAATSSSGLPLTYTSSNTAVATVSGTTVTVVGIGATDLTASQAGDANYNPAADSVQSLNVTTKTLTITGITVMDKLQDGTTAAAVSGTAVLNGIVAGDEAEVVLSGTPTATFASALPGTGIAVSVTGYAITGAKASNYSLTQPELTATITALEIPVATPATAVTTDSFTANWNAVPGATGYELDVYTVDAGDNATDLFISEYVEGSSNNKAIEIYNGTGGAVNLSTYSLQKQNNGGGSFGSILSLSGIIENGETYIIANNSASTAIKNIANLTTTSSALTFNGNDAVALYNDVNQIDVVGVIDDISDWGKDITLVRNTTATAPSTNFSLSDWQILATDNISNLGMHNFNAGTTTTYFIQNQNVGNVTSYEVSGLNPNTHYFYVVRAVNGTASSNSNEVAATTSGPFLWTGATNNSWSEASNWFGNAVPDGSKDVLIASGTPVLDTDYTLPTATSLVLADTAVLTLAPTATLTIAGSADFGGKSVVLQSDATGTAAIGQVTGTLANATNVTVERYIPAKRAWRFLTAPLQGTSNNALVANWQGVAEEGALLFAPATYQSQTMTGYAVGGSAPNIFKYNAGWQAIPDLASEIMFGATANDTQAYQIFVTGASNSTNIATGATATTLRPKGTLITGTVNHVVTANAYKLLPNPYASPIDTEAMVANNAGSKVWLLDPTIGFGAYVTYDGLNWSAPISGTDKNIQSGQGFFVKSTATSFAVQEAFKVNGNSNTWFERVSNTEDATKIRVLLYKQNATDWQLADAILAVNSLNGNTAVDAADASKIANYNESLMFRNGTSNLAIEYRALPQANEMQPLRLTGTTATGYQLRIHLESFNESSLVPLLEDTQLGTFTAIPTDGTPVIIPFTGVASTATNPDDRFRMVYQTALSNDSFENGKIVVYPNPVSQGRFFINLPQGEGAIFELYNVLGQKVQQGELAAATNSVDVSGLQSGVYIVTVVQSGKKFTTKIMVGSH